MDEEQEAEKGLLLNYVDEWRTGLGSDDWRVWRIGMTWLREPLFHFLLIGALLFGLHALVKDPRVQSTNGKQIEVSASDMQMLRDRWIKQWGQPPVRPSYEGLSRTSSGKRSCIGRLWRSDWIATIPSSAVSWA